MDIVFIGVLTFLAGAGVGALTVNRMWGRAWRKSLSWYIDGEDKFSPTVRDALGARKQP